MTTATSTFGAYDRSIPASSSSVNFPMSDNSNGPRQNRNLFATDTQPMASRVGHCLDDMDILTLRRQYANLDLFEQSTLSNSAEDLSQLDHLSYPFPIYDPDLNDIDDDDLPFDEGNSYDYTVAIQERLKKANEELEHDQTPSELKHSQRVSFDAIVKAVDIIQDPNEHEHEHIDPIVRPSISPVTEESNATINSPRSDTSTHEYTVPLNDTQPKEGLSLLEQIKALQFHGILPAGERWATTAHNVNNDSLSNRDEDLSVTSFKSTENNLDSQDNSNMTSNSASSKKSMIVAVNGRIEMQDEDDYTAKHQRHPSPQTETNSSITKNKNLFVPTPPKEPKQKQDSRHRPFPVRPKSSETSRTKSSSDKKNNTETTNRQRPKSAVVSKSVETYVEKRPSSGVDFNELLRKAAEKKRAELKEERRKQAKAEEKRQIEVAKAKESYERWLQEKDSERKRINEEKRLEMEEKEARQAEEEKKLTELREKSYKDWLERKAQQAMIADEFKKLKAYEDSMTSGGSSSSINSNRTNNHRAFQRWLRQKYEKTLEEKRQLRLEGKRQRRRQRRSIKRHQLQQDLQLAKSFGYS